MLIVEHICYVIYNNSIVMVCLLLLMFNESLRINCWFLIIQINRQFFASTNTPPTTNHHREIPVCTATMLMYLIRHVYRIQGLGNVQSCVAINNALKWQR